MKSGFTLIEIMVVILILSVLATLSILSMVRFKMDANEAGAISSCKTIFTACQNYYSYVIPHTYPPDLTTLNTVDPPYIDSVLANGEKQGYQFVYTLIDENHFTVNANPSVLGNTGNRYFFIDESGVIKSNSTEQAGPDDPPIS